MAKGKTITKEEFNKRCIDNGNDKFIFDDTVKYTKPSSEMTASCINCGFRLTRRSTSFSNNVAKCPLCGGGKVRNFDEWYSRFKHTDFDRFILFIFNKDTYSNTSNKIETTCNICGHVWYPTPSTIDQGCGCPRCATLKVAKLNRITIDEFKNMCISNDMNWIDFNSDIKFIGLAHNAEVYCKNCRNKIIRHGSQIAYGKMRGCPICGNGTVHNDYEWRKRFYLNNPNIDDKLDLTEFFYSGSGKHSYVTCKICSHKYLTTPHNLDHGKRCQKCEGCKRKITHDAFYNNCIQHGITWFDKSGIINFDGSNSYVDIICKYCGCIVNRRALDIYQNVGENSCPCCGSGQVYSHKEWLHKLQYHKPEVFDRFELLGKYINTYTKIPIRCKKCGHEWGMNPSKIWIGRGCPKCHITSGEYYISYWLDNYSVNYTLEKTFDDLIGLGGKKLRFDFYLPDYNILIEFDGHQHHTFPNAYHKSIENFNKLQEHDRRKNDYCDLNNIYLIRINETKSNYSIIKETIEESLNTYLLPFIQ